MLEYCVVPTTASRFRAGPASLFLDGFAHALLADGYAPTTSAAYLHAADHLGRWTVRQGGALETLDEAQLARFVRHLPTCGCPDRPRHGRKGVPYQAARFLQYLRQTGVVTRRPAPATQGPLVTEYVAWLRDLRGLAPMTIRRSVRVIEALLRAVAGDPTRLDATSVRRFVLTYIRAHAPASPGCVTAVVRGFLRWLVMCGRCVTDLPAAVPTVPTWSLARLPRALPAPAIERIIDACARPSPMGRRDHAMVLLLARLGLRASDVVGLRLNDLDWVHGRLCVTGKSRRATWLPLPQEAGDALLHYLETARPAAPTDAVFLTVRAPLRPISVSGLRDVVGRAIARTGLPAPSRGTHVLRHSLATRLLGDGASLDTIGALLRHRDINTTAVYAKVDVDRLRQVAQPWPGAEVSPC